MNASAFQQPPGRPAVSAILLVLLLLLAGALAYDGWRYGVAAHAWTLTQASQALALAACLFACLRLTRRPHAHKEFGLLGAGFIMTLLLHEFSRLDQWLFPGFTRLATLLVYILCAMIVVRNWQQCLDETYRFLRSRPGRVLAAGVAAWILLSMLFYADMPWFDLHSLRHLNLQGAPEQIAESLAYGAILYGLWVYCARDAGRNNQSANALPRG